MSPSVTPPHEQVLNVLNGFSADGKVLGHDGGPSPDAPDTRMIAELYAAITAYLEAMLAVDLAPDAARTSLIMVLLAALQTLRPNAATLRQLVLLFRTAAGISTH